MRNVIRLVVGLLFLTACGEAPQSEPAAMLDTEVNMTMEEELSFSDTCGYFNPIDIQSDLDVNKYLGEWYELATSAIVRNTFERGCSCTKATYTLQADGVQVKNACTQGDGSENIIFGSAKFTGRQGVLGVGFPEGDADSANYYVMKVETDEKGNYEMALVGEPCRLFLWILSRKPVLDTDEDFQRYNNLLAFAEENDYNLDSWYLNFQPTEQASCGWETECTEVVDTYQTECQYFWQGCGDGYEQVERSSCKLGWWDWARTGSKRTCERVERVCQ